MKQKAERQNSEEQWVINNVEVIYGKVKSHCSTMINEMGALFASANQQIYCFKKLDDIKYVLINATHINNRII